MISIGTEVTMMAAYLIASARIVCSSIPVLTPPEEIRSSILFWIRIFLNTSWMGYLDSSDK